MADGISLRAQMDGRIAGLKTDRYSWWVYWQSLAEFILPRRYKWLITPNQWNRGSPINGAIIDSTGTIAAQRCAAGMMAGITSPTRPWFKLRIDGIGDDDSHPINVWLAECEKRMMRVFQESNFYTAMAVLYHDLVVFGTAPMIIYEDFENVIRCYNPCAGEYYVANSSRLSVDTLCREFTLTVPQVVQWFGEENCSTNVKNLWKTGGASLIQEVVICHVIEPRREAHGISDRFAFVELYYEQSSTEPEKWLMKRGFNELPFICPRWDLVANDAYGRSPAMDALGDIKQLQQETRRKAQAIDKLVNPPMIADVQLKNQPASLIPGGVTYVAGNPQSNIGFKPVYQVQPQIEHMMNDLKEIQERIRVTFFNDLFMMISQLQTVRTATEIDARREEKLVMLGPVLERVHHEALDPAIDRTFNIMNRAGLFPPAPPEIQGRHMQVEYVSMLATAQRAVETSGIERVMQIVGNMSAINPEIPDNINWDEAVYQYATLLSVSPKIIRPRDQVEEIRAARLQEKQQAEALAVTDASVKGAKTLSETEIGGGENALQAMLANQGVMQ